MGRVGQKLKPYGHNTAAITIFLRSQIEDFKMPGRKPIPTALKILKGTARPHRINDKEPQVEVAKPQPAPVWLNSDAKKEWVRLFDLLTKSGVITDLDTSMLATFCQMWGEYIAGFKSGDPVGVTHMTQMRLMAAEFGLTPSSRSKVEAIIPESNEYDPWDQFD